MGDKKTILKPWAGRFSESTDVLVEQFNASVDFDKILFKYDIQGSIAHAKILAQAGVLTQAEGQQIVSGLETIYKEINDGKFQWQVALEDVHMNIEARLIEMIGDVGKKLHTGRSRNDQVATDLRLYLKAELSHVQKLISNLQQEILVIAERESATILPGFTHLQVAQVVTFGHHLMAWFEMLQRDYDRFMYCYTTADVSPLGSAALAGTSYPLDRMHTAALLGFSRISNNSLDAVSDRDFVIEFCAAASILFVHLSRMMEELILWSSTQFGFIDLPDRFATGSSIMPQKKNPDVPELIRGKSGRVIGNLMAALMLMKAQPLAYNKDNQEDKELLFDSVVTTKTCLEVFARLVPGIKVNAETMRKAALQGYPTATDFADYLVSKGVAFRDAHRIVGEAVKLALASKKDLTELSLAELKTLSPHIDKDIYAVLSLEGSLNGKTTIGGTAPQQVRTQIKKAHALLRTRAGNVS